MLSFSLLLSMCSVHECDVSREGEGRVCVWVRRRQRVNLYACYVIKKWNFSTFGAPFSVLYFTVFQHALDHVLCIRFHHQNHPIICRWHPRKLKHFTQKIRWTHWKPPIPIWSRSVQIHMPCGRLNMETNIFRNLLKARTCWFVFAVIILIQ